MTNLPNRPDRRDHLIAVCLAVATFFALVFTSSEVGVPRDESFYFMAGDRGGDYWLGLVDDPAKHLTRAAVDVGFKYNHEHPVLMKSLFGISHRLLHDRWQIVDDHRLAYRIPSMALWGLASALTFLLARLVASRAVGFVAALAFVFMPRTFFHAHLSCFDGPVAAMSLLIVYTYVRAMRSRAWSIASGLALGLGLATKLNTFFVPFVLFFVTVIDVAVYRLRMGRFLAPSGQRGPLTYGLWTGVSMIVLGALVFFAHWPWLWFDTVPRLREYIAFHAHHVNYPVDYLGTLYYDPPFPVHFPIVMTLSTVPFATLLLGLVGLVGIVRSVWSFLREHRADVPQAPPWALVVLFNFCAPIAVIAWPTTPIFGGIKHWMPAMPFLALMVGLGVERLVKGLRLAESQRFRGLVVAGLGAVLLLPAARDTFVYGAYGEAYYNELVGGPLGAAELRLPRNFWGYATIGALPQLDTEAADGALVFWHDATSGSVDAYKRDGLLRGDLRYAGDWMAALSTWGVYHDQRDKLWEELDIWRAYGTDWPVGGVFVDGVQLIGLYRRPKASGAVKSLPID